MANWRIVTLAEQNDDVREFWLDIDKAIAVVRIVVEGREVTSIRMLSEDQPLMVSELPADLLGFRRPDQPEFKRKA